MEPLLMTLLEHSGVTLKTDLRQSALVLVDYQNEYVSGKLPLDNVAHAIEETEQLLSFARGRKIPVIHVVHNGGKGGLFDRNRPEGEIVDALEPIAGETVIEKSMPNSFVRTELEAKLKELGKSEILLAGLMSHMCLTATAEAAVDRGFGVTIVASTTTTRDLRGVNGEKRAAKEVTASVLALLQDRFARVVPTLEGIY